MNIYVLDVDISPCPDFEDWMPPLQAPGNYTKPESIDKWLDENLPLRPAKAALDVLGGEIVDSVFLRSDGKEAEVLWQGIKGAQLLDALFGKPGDLLTVDMVSSHLYSHIVFGYNIKAVLFQCLANALKQGQSFEPGVLEHIHKGESLSFWDPRRYLLNDKTVDIEYFHKLLGIESGMSEAPVLERAKSLLLGMSKVVQD